MLLNTQGTRKKWSMKIVFILGMVGLLTLIPILGCGPAKSEGDTILYRHSWITNGKMSPYYLGIDKGFFREEGIELTVVSGKGSSLNLKLIATGQLLFGSVDLTVAMTGIAEEGLPVIGLAVTEQLAPMAIITRADTGITHPTHLVGKTYAVSAGSSESLLFPLLAKKVGLDLNQVEAVFAAAEVLPSLLADKKVDAILGYYTSTSPKVASLGVSVVNMPYKDYGINILADALVTHTSMVEDNPDLVKRFVRAMQKSFVYGYQHPEESMDAYMNYNIQADRDVEMEGMQETMPLAQTPNSQGMPFGWISSVDVEVTQDALIEGGDIDPANKLPVESYYTNEFIDDEFVLQ